MKSLPRAGWRRPSFARSLNGASSERWAWLFYALCVSIVAGGFVPCSESRAGEPHSPRGLLAALAATSPVPTGQSTASVHAASGGRIVLRNESRQRTAVPDAWKCGQAASPAQRSSCGDPQRHLPDAVLWLQSASLSLSARHVRLQV